MRACCAARISAGSPACHPWPGTARRLPSAGLRSVRTGRFGGPWSSASRWACSSSSATAGAPKCGRLRRLQPWAKRWRWQCGWRAGGKGSTKSTLARKRRAVSGRLPAGRSTRPPSRSARSSHPPSRLRACRATGAEPLPLLPDSSMQAAAAQKRRRRAHRPSSLTRSCRCSSKEAAMRTQQAASANAGEVLRGVCRHRCAVRCCQTGVRCCGLSSTMTGALV